MIRVTADCYSQPSVFWTSRRAVVNSSMYVTFRPSAARVAG